MTDPLDQELTDLQKQIDGAKKNNGLARAKSKTIEVLPPDQNRRYDDLANAEMFLDTFGEDLLYCGEAKKWMIWNGSHWKADGEDFVFELAADFAKGMYAEVTDSDSFKNAKRANMRAGMDAFMTIAQRKKNCSIKSFDRDPMLINCKNGTLNLSTGQIHPHDRQDRLTRVVNTDYDSMAVSPTFDRFLTDVQPDPSIRAFLQRSIGYSLLGVVRERSFWILYGTGNNGKSVFLNLFNTLLGEYASGTTAASIMAGKQNSIPNDLARLKGKRFVIIPETSENEKINSALVKALSAGDTITARFLFGEYFDFPFTGKLWIATNHKPRITDHSKGMWDRLKLVPFTQSIPAEKVIKADDLMRSLMAEASGILNWAVLGCRDYFDLEGLDDPDAIKAEVAQYKYEQDSMMQFFDECCETIEQWKAETPEMYAVESDFNVDNPKLFKAYQKYCKQNGESEIPQRVFSLKLKDRGFSQRRNGAKRYWIGFRLNDTIDLE